MRRLLLAVAAVGLVGCGHSKASGPAWPEPSTTADDGGESIAPKPTATYAAVAEKAAEVEADKSEDKPAATTPAATTDDKAATTPATTTPASEEVIMTEEIIIEIED